MRWPTPSRRPPDGPGRRAVAKDVASRGVQSVEVGGRILNAMIAARRPVMLREIVAGAGIAPAQAHAYLVSFRKIGMVEQEGAAGRYQLGPLALQLGLARLRSFDPLRLAGSASAELAVELGLMATVTVWGSFGATIVQVHEATDQVHVNLRAGAVYSLTGTATGRVFAAFLPAGVTGPSAAAEFARTNDTQRVGAPTTPGDFERDLEVARQLGYATAAGSPVPGINAVAAPVFDHTGHLQLAVTLVGPAGRVAIGRDSALVHRVLAFTRDVSAQLGFGGDPVPSTAMRGVAGR